MSIWSGTHIVVIDTETTGMSPTDGHALIEVATVELEDGAIGERWSSLVQPGRPIPPDATRVHGISDAMVAGAPAPSAVAALLRARCADHAVAFHNSPFDLPFVQALLAAGGAEPLTNPVVDTLGLARAFTGEGGNALQALRTRYRLPEEPAHRALGDALTTARLLLALGERWQLERGVHSFDELAAASQDVMRLTTKRESVARTGAASPA